MKSRIYVFLLALCALSIMPRTVRANDYLEHFRHYTAYGDANNSIKFTLPIWVYGSINDYYVTDESYIYATCEGTTYTIFWFCAEQRGLNDGSGDKGEGYLKLENGRIVVDTYDGTSVEVPANGAFNHYYTKRKDDDDHKRISYFTLKWYPPAAFDGKEFTVGVYSSVKNKRTGGRPGGPYNWTWDTHFQGNAILQSPEIFTPYLYTYNDQGKAGFGSAAIPYATYQTPVSYTTSLGASATTKEQSGQIFVATKDDVQANFSVAFEVWRDTDQKTKATLNTNAVKIPAYHRPYNIVAAEQHDADTSLTGYVQLQWEVKTPQAEDLVEGDCFELQRATKKDFSDAQSIAMIPFSHDSTVYHYIDDVREIGNTAVEEMVTETKLFDIHTPDSSTEIVTFKASMTGEMPNYGVPLYYRVRRASAGVWGWDNNDFAINTSLYKNAHLAPLADQQAEYRLDSDFVNNRKVHFDLKIDNQLIRVPVLPIDSFDFTFEQAEIGPGGADSFRVAYAEKYLKEHSDSIRMTVKLDFQSFINHYMATLDSNRTEIKVSYYTAGGQYVNEQYMTKVPGQKETFQLDFVPCTTKPDSVNTMMYTVVVYETLNGYALFSSGELPLTLPIWMPFKTELKAGGSVATGDLVIASPAVIDTARINYPGIEEYLKPIMDSLYLGSFDQDSIRQAMYNEQILPIFAGQDSLSRCVWDRNAMLILTRHMEELGLSQQIIVPADSIIRQPDGSWLAHVTDVADVSCTHYNYTAQIDASHSLLRLRLPEQSLPIEIHGPDLYTDQAATIGSFTATQGTDKQGVLLLWEPTAGGLTEYVLKYREHGSSAPFEDLVTTTDVGYRVTDIPPSKHYDYQLTIRYECNGNTSESSKEVEGWRSPYGSISGRVTLPDGSGNEGVTVVLSADTGDVCRVLTKADGSYLIDSILYEASGSHFTVTPTSQNGEFVYNNTSSDQAPVTLSMNRSEATDIEFVNKKATRLTGRVLYHGTTIPVADAKFLLNGNPVSYAGSPVKTQQDGSFNMQVPMAPIVLQVYKEGHHFTGDGYLRINGDSLIQLDAPQDGLRFWDETTVRVAGRLVGGNDQGNLPIGFGLSRNNLGDDLEIVMELEGDNISYMIRDPQDPTITERDTTFAHLVQGKQGVDTVGTTDMHVTQKRLFIHPDIKTGEFAVDLWPVRYKITRLTAEGYATLFSAGAGSETIDLTSTVNEHVTDYYVDTTENRADTVTYNTIYKHIYHAPITLSVIQRNYGVDCDYYGEETLPVSSMAVAKDYQIPLIDRDSATGEVHYVFNYPVYRTKTYTYRAWAYEEYFYNNNRSAGRRDRVNMHGGTLTVHNGMHSSQAMETMTLNPQGQADFKILVDDPEFISSGEAALRTISVTAEIENDFINAEPIRGFITGNRIEEQDIRTTNESITILDILRDPPGANSSAYLEKGATYHYAYEVAFDIKLGVEIDLNFGTDITNVIGTWAGAAAGAFTGMNYSTSKQTVVPIPIVMNNKGVFNYAYDITTTERISTSNAETGVGSGSDVFLGVNNAFIYGVARAARIIDEPTWKLRQQAYQDGSLKLLATGTHTDGSKFYMVVGSEVVLGSTITNSFAYTQDYILNHEIPKLLRERDALLLTGTKEEVQAAANATGRILYYSHPSHPDSLGHKGHYTQIVPKNATIAEPDMIMYYQKTIDQWLQCLKMNERQKIAAKQAGGRRIGTWSVAGGVSRSYSENFSYSASSAYQPTIGVEATSSALGSLFEKAGDAVVLSVARALEAVKGTSASTGTQEISCQAPGTKFHVSLKPIFSADVTPNIGSGQTHTKTMGFTLAPDPLGYLTTEIYTYVDSAFMKASADEQSLTHGNKNDSLYCGSFVYSLVGGASVCPHEEAEYSVLHSPGTLLSHGTLKVEDPRISIDAHDRSDVPADKPAIFSITISNDGQLETADPSTFSLTQPATANPYGAKIYIDGMPVTSDKSSEANTEFTLRPGQSATKVMEVYRGNADDYDNLQLCLSSTSCLLTKDYLNFSVHFLPSSSDVVISSPHDRWTLNTFSAHDSVGYYMPITIEGFDVNHRGFDHIEFQYKLSTQSDDAWVNQCSFYANDSLYEAATGNKAKITNGRINTLRFYGERDPIEQHYDLRAVTFCRHGSGFVSKASNVLSGIKDTRMPRVFGHPQPANGVLTINDDIRLRFNEPIAGNYLDEDNNFYIVGGTNKSGITTSTALSFDGGKDSFAASKVSRDLSGRNITIDLLVKPLEHGKRQTVFSHGYDSTAFRFGITEDNRLFAAIGQQEVQSKVLDPLLDFNRLIVTCDTLGAVHFFAGTLDVTDGNSRLQTYHRSDNLVFGRGLHGDMLEARVWTKALHADDVALTHMRRLTGYEQELLAYYPMDEAKGTTCTDKANGATLYMYGAGWNLPSGLSMYLTDKQSITLDQDKFARTSKQDYTLMLWFRTEKDDAPIFRAGWVDSTYTGTRIAIEQGQLVFRNNTLREVVSGNYNDNNWHHFSMTVNRPYNNASIFVDGQLLNSMAASDLDALGGLMLLGGDGFVGHIDEVVMYEQALPKTLLETHDNLSPDGDEMGLMALLAFETQHENDNGVLELVFSPNDQRIFRDTEGNIVNKTVPLILSSEKQPMSAIEAMADKTIFAPLKDRAQISKMNFDWSFNNDELMINLNMADREINKQTVYITVRDVEDLNGNRMQSPVMWTAYIDRNSLKWSERKISKHIDYEDTETLQTADVLIINNSGNHHQYSIESLPAWLSVDNTYGTLNPLEQQTLRLTFNNRMSVGTYSDIIYLTDENQLSEPLQVELVVTATSPYEDIDRNKYPLNMSICGQVRLLKDGATILDTDPNDIVYAMYRNECIGMANISYDNTIGTSSVFLTVYGNESMDKKHVNFLLWQASTGRVYNLLTDRTLHFHAGQLFGCGDDTPVIFTTGGRETQNIALNAGWTWISFNLNLNTSTGSIGDVLTAAEPWAEGDIIKNPAEKSFVTYSADRDDFIGTFTAFDFASVYMVYCHNANTMRVTADRLPEDSMSVTLLGDKQWSPLPCLFQQTMPISEALSDYYDHATAGDLIKSHDHFAVFSQDKHWVGDLTALRPGEGYLFRRVGKDNVEVNFYNTSQNPTPAPKQAPAQRSTLNTQRHATNMTMIAVVEGMNELKNEGVNVYLGDELVGVATPIDGLYFLTISSDAIGSELRFETEDGTSLTPINSEAINGAERLPDGTGRAASAERGTAVTINYIPDSHHGSLKVPIVLRPGDNRPYKIIENNHVIIIRNNEKYDVTGKKL